MTSLLCCCKKNKASLSNYKEYQVPKIRKVSEMSAKTGNQSRKESDFTKILEEQNKVKQSGVGIGMASGHKVIDMMEYLNYQENAKAFNDYRNQIIENRNKLYSRMNPEILEVFSGGKEAPQTLTRKTLHDNKHKTRRAQPQSQQKGSEKTINIDAENKDLEAMILNSFNHHLVQQNGLSPTQKREYFCPDEEMLRKNLGKEKKQEKEQEQKRLDLAQRRTVGAKRHTATALNFDQIRQFMQDSSPKKREQKEESSFSLQLHQIDKHRSASPRKQIKSLKNVLCPSKIQSMQAQSSQNLSSLFYGDKRPQEPSNKCSQMDLIPEVEEELHLERKKRQRKRKISEKPHNPVGKADLIIN